MLADEVRLIDDSFYVIGRKDYENAGDGTARRKSLGELMAGIDTDRLVISLEHEPRFLQPERRRGRGRDALRPTRTTASSSR